MAEMCLASICRNSTLRQVTLNCMQSAIYRNEPHVHFAKMEPNPSAWRGTELGVTILGNWQYYRAKILKYLRQIAVITPYARFACNYVAEEAKNSFSTCFHRRTEKMPQAPKVGRMHLLTQHPICQIPLSKPFSALPDTLSALVCTFAQPSLRCLPGQGPARVATNPTLAALPHNTAV